MQIRFKSNDKNYLFKFTDKTWQYLRLEVQNKLNIIMTDDQIVNFLENSGYNDIHQDKEMYDYGVTTPIVKAVNYYLTSDLGYPALKIMPDENMEIGMMVEEEDKMKAWEVLKALEEGKKMTCDKWSGNEYIYLDENKDIIMNDALGNQVFFDIPSFFASEWREYEDSIKVGDYAVSKGCGTVFKVDEIENGYVSELSFDNPFTLPVQEIRKARDEERINEINRRRWEFIGREVNQYKVDDIVEAGGEMFEVLTVYDDMVFINNKPHPDDYSPEELKLVCPVEHRFDN